MFVGKALEELVLVEAGCMGLDGTGSELLVEVRHVALAMDNRNEEGFDFLADELTPVDSAEPGVSLETRDVLHALYGVLDE